MGAPATARIAAAAGAARGDGDGGGSGWKWGLAGFAAALLALLLFLAVPAVLITQQNQCEPTAVAEGTADPITLDQLQVAARIAQVGEEMNRPERHQLAALATAFVESEMQNLPPEKSDNDANPNKVSTGHVTSVGVFQQQDFLPWTKTGRNRMNVRDAARTFYEQAQLLDRPGMTIGQLAQEVQGSAFPGKYEPRVPDAERILARVREDATLLADADADAAASAAHGGSAAGRSTSAPGTTAAGGEVKLAWPVGGDHRINSPFGPRSSPCPGCSSRHEGADINAPEGMPVHAAAGGRIVQRGWVGGYGNYVCIRHQARFATCYAHLSRYGSYQMGATVDQGAVIGYAGDTGVGTGPHLHFEVRLSGGPGDPAVNPIPFLTGATTPTGDVDATAAMASGGCSDDASDVREGEGPIAPGPIAELHGKILWAPRNAPADVKKMIAAGNAIQILPYTYAAATTRATGAARATTAPPRSATCCTRPGCATASRWTHRRSPAGANRGPASG